MPLTDTDIAKIWGYKNPTINGTRDAYGVLTDTRNKAAAVVSEIWGVKPTGTSTFGEMLMHVKMRLSNGTAPQAAGLSEVADLRREMLEGFAEIKKTIGS